MTARNYKDGTPFRFVPCRQCDSSEDGCDRCQQYRCISCRRWRPWEYGGHPDIRCDACWTEPEDVTYDRP